MITYAREKDHYVIYIDGEFYCTADDIREVKKEIDSIKKEQKEWNQELQSITG